MKIIKIKKSEIKTGRDVTPVCDRAKIVHINKDRYVITFSDDLPPIGFRSKILSRLLKRLESPIIFFSAAQHACICCGAIEKEIVLTLQTEDMEVYQIDDSQTVILQIRLEI